MGVTNRGKTLQFDWVYRAVPLPSNFYLALVTAAIPPTAATTTLGQLTEIAAGNGYTTGGVALTPGTTDFDGNVQNDTANRAELHLRQIVWTAAGGSIPASGDGARYAVQTTDEGVVANRQVMCWWDLGSPRSALDGQLLPLIDLVRWSEDIT